MASSQDFPLNLADLPSVTPSKVLMWAFRFQSDPTAAGIKYEKINKARDANLRSVRIDQDWRALSSNRRAATSTFYCMSVTTMTPTLGKESDGDQPGDRGRCSWSFCKTWQRRLARPHLTLRWWARFGYRLLHILLAREGLAVNHQRVHRIYQVAGLQLGGRRRKRLTRAERVPLPPASQRLERWLADGL